MDGLLCEEEASSTRRAALVAFTAAAVSAARSAAAITIPSQANTGGLSREMGRGQASSNASFTAYTLEGPAKGGHSVKQKNNVLAEARAAAEVNAAKK